MLKLGASITAVNRRKAPIAIDCLNPNYTSDFTGGTDGWSAGAGVHSIGAPFSVGGEDNAIRGRSADATSPDAPSTINKTLGTSTTAGCVYSYSLKYYTPTANNDLLFIDSITAGGTTTSVDSSEPTNDAWITKTGTFTATSATTAFSIAWNDDNDTGPGSDILYIKDIVLELN